MAVIGYILNGKDIIQWRQWNIIPWFIALAMEKVWFHEKLLFEVVMVMIRDKICSMKDIMPIKISFMHYMKWTRIMLPLVF